MAATLTLRTGALDALRDTHGLTKDVQLAAAMNVSPASVSRVLAGEQAPGSRFMASLVTAFPGVTLDDLFEIEVA
jgi:transcriptional regulator with XRE-family HTH domain